MRDPALRIENKRDPNRSTLEAQIIEYHAILLRRDLLESERVVRQGGQFRPPIRRERGTPADPGTLARAVEPGAISKEVKQPLEITPPAAIEPVHHHGHFIELMSQVPLANIDTRRNAGPANGGRLNIV